MIVSDYTLSWVSSRRAVLSWNGGSPDCWFTIFVDSVGVSVYGSGDMSLELSLSERENHTFLIIQHEAGPTIQDSPESPRLLRPIVSWLQVEHAAEYEIRQVQGDSEFLLRKQPSSASEIQSWQVPTNLPGAGLGTFRVRVYARGSFGLCETPSIVVGFACGYPSRAASMSVEASESSLELVLATA